MHTIIIIDDDRLILQTLPPMLSPEHYQVICFDNYHDFIEQFDQDESAIVMIDLNLPGRSGVDVMKECLQVNEYCVYILISAFFNIELARTVFKSGAYDVLVKPIEAFSFNECLNGATEALVEKKKNYERFVHARETLDDLTEREQHVLECMMKGHTIENIAQALNMSKNTYNVHRRSILQKTNCDNLIQLARIYAIVHQAESI